MLATILFVVCGLLLVSERADRVQSARVRAVSETGLDRRHNGPASIGPGYVPAGRSPVSLTAPRPAGLYRGHSAAYYAAEYRAMWKRYTQARRALRQSLQVPVYGLDPLERAFMCIHGFEGSWTDSGSPHWGGLQMDMDFQRTYGDWALAAFGTADHWPISVQLAVAIRAKVSGRGFYPWPNTARMCGLI